MHKRIILDKVVLVDRATKDAIGEELPANGEAEDVKAVVVDKVLQLALAVSAASAAATLRSRCTSRPWNTQRWNTQS